jgi:hypothetical protein
VQGVEADPTEVSPAARTAPEARVLRASAVVLHVGRDEGTQSVPRRRVRLLQEVHQVHLRAGAHVPELLRLDPDVAAQLLQRRVDDQAEARL